MGRTSKDLVLGHLLGQMVPGQNGFEPMIARQPWAFFSPARQRGAPRAPLRRETSPHLSDARAHNNFRKSPELLALRETINRAHNPRVTLGYRFAQNLELSLSATHAGAERSRTLRSRITNGKDLLANVEGRTAAARRYRDLCLSLADDLGGAATWAEAQRALVRQAAAMIVQSEKLHGEVLRGEIVDCEQLTRLANAATRILSRLGLKRPFEAPR